MTDPDKESESVSIKLTTYTSLQEDSAKLNALEAAGVDNWDGYDVAMDMLNGNI